MRAPVFLVAAGAAAVLSGCGGDGEPGAARAMKPVVLSVSAPGDLAVVDGDSVEVRGSVEPAGAAVRVLGERADVSDGEYYASVALEPGVNVIDVMATARGREPAMTALRVTREMPVAVPDLAGLEVNEAQEELAAAGLELEVEQGGGLLDELFSGEPVVCEQHPEEGEEVRRGSMVEVLVARSC
jgi:Glucodextranase, domain B/PASTA domain